MMFGLKGLDLSKFYDISPNLLCILSKDLKIKSVNQTFIASTGYKESEIKGKKLTLLLNPDDIAVTENVLAKLIEAPGFEEQITNRLLMKNKSNMWLSWMFFNKDDQIYALAINKTEDQKTRNDLLRKNREIEQERASIDAMLSNIGEGVVGISDKGEITYMNISAEQMLGITATEVIGKIFIQEIKSVDEKSNPVNADTHPVRLAMSKSKTAYSRDIYLQKQDGKAFPASITASPVLLQGNLIGGVIIFRDITKEKEIDRMKTEFISLASHQLRTPLSAMKWFSEMLLDGDIGELSKEQREVVENIGKSNQRMIELVNSLLNISRIESGRMIVDPQPTDLKQLVDEVVLELQPKIREKNHNLAISVHGDLPKINVDPKLIRHVYMNLLTNAIKYTPKTGEIIVLISKSGDSIVSQVSDNGLGVPKSQQDKLFQKFFRAENVVRVVTDGTGLGLYLIKAIVESSGGKIWFQSEEGKGSTFWFSLPIAGSPAMSGEVSIDS